MEQNVKLQERKFSYSPGIAIDSHRNTEIIEHLRKLNERLTFKEVR